MIATTTTKLRKSPIVVIKVVLLAFLSFSLPIPPKLAILSFSFDNPCRFPGLLTLY
jgi:hypothetical protein